MRNSLIFSAGESESAVELLNIVTRIPPKNGALTTTRQNHSVTRGHLVLGSSWLEHSHLHFDLILKVWRWSKVSCTVVMLLWWHGQTNRQLQKVSSGHTHYKYCIFSDYVNCFSLFFPTQKKEVVFQFFLSVCFVRVWAVLPSKQNIQSWGDLNYKYVSAGDDVYSAELRIS